MTAVPQLYPPAEASPFDRLVCAVDGTPASLEAARQACRLAPGRPLALVCALDTLEELDRPGEIPARSHHLRRVAEDIVEQARADLRRSGAVGVVEVAVEEGLLVDVLAFVTGGDVRTLLALGSPRGSVPTPAHMAGVPDEQVLAQHERLGTVVRQAPCSVLVARRPRGPAAFPSIIAVGLDGSETSLRAYAVAIRLSDATGAALRYVVALGGKGVDMDTLQAVVPELPLSSVDQRSPVRALVASDADLVVVGHRGLHGLRALGSVGERVVARSPASVLVVR